MVNATTAELLRKQEELEKKARELEKRERELESHGLGPGACKQGIACRCWSFQDILVPSTQKRFFGENAFVFSVSADRPHGSYVFAALKHTFLKPGPTVPYVFPCYDSCGRLKTRMLMRKLSFDI